MTKQHRNGKTTTEERPQTTPEQAPQSGVQLVLVLNGAQAGGQFLPLADTYVQTEAGLQTLFTGLRDTLARLYEDRARQMAASESQRAQAEHQRAEGLAEELRLLKEQMAAREVAT